MITTIEVGDVVTVKGDDSEVLTFTVDQEESPLFDLTNDQDYFVVQIITGIWKNNGYRGIALVMSDGTIDWMRPELQWSEYRIQEKEEDAEKDPDKGEE